MSVEHLVYVGCATFNQSSCIKESLDGFCKQETTFPFVCGILDDASTDGEQEVISRYLDNYFDLEDESVVIRDETDDYKRVYAQHKTNKNCYFVVVYLKYNHYSIRKSKIPYVAKWCEKAKFIAFCEGDDYWITKNKLQQQVDYFESHEQCGLVYTKAKVLSAESGRFTGFVGEKCESFAELLLKNTIPTLTVMCRTDIYYAYYENIVPSKRGWKMGDYPLWLYIAANRDIHFINSITSVYRILPESASHTKDYKTRLAFQKSTRDVRVFFAERYGLGGEVKDGIDDVYWREKSNVLKGKDKRAYKKALMSIKKKSLKEIIKTVLMLIYPF